MVANNLGQYSKAQVLWNGQLLAEEASVTLKRASNAQQVKTVAKGFAGMTVGAAMTSGTVSNAVPSSGFELDPGPFINQVLQGQLTIIIGDPSEQQFALTVNAFITDDNFSHAVDANSKLDFDFIAQPGDWVAC